MSNELEYFARRGALLLPCLTRHEARGKAKDPNTSLMLRTNGTGRFANGGASGNPAIWKEWAQQEPGCAYAVWAGGSRLIIVDIDTKVGREAAWQYWHDWCHPRGLPTFAPHAETPSGGWHVYFYVPNGVDATTLRQPDLVRAEKDGKPFGVINVRAGNGYVLVPPSRIDAGAYRFFDLSRDPYPAPEALLAHCANVDNRQTAVTTPESSAAVFDPTLYTSRDREIARMKFLADVAVFAQSAEGGRNQELNKIAFKHAGSVRAGLLDATEYEIQLMDACDKNGLTADDGEEQCLKTVLSAIGGAARHNVTPQAPKPVSLVFAGVDLQAATMQAAALPAGANALFGQTAQYVGELGMPVLMDVLQGLPNACAISEHPTLPDAMKDHPLYAVLQDFLSRLFALIETCPAAFNTGCVAPALGVLMQANETVFDSVCRNIYSRGVRFNEGRVRFAGKQFADRIQREMLTLSGWQTTARGEPERDNPDNVRVLLRMLNCELRYNAWTEQAEIKGGPWDDWTYVDDVVVGRLLVIAGQSGNRFTPGEQFFWRTVGELAREKTYDPASALLDAFEAKWDGLPRLDTWLEVYCGLPDPSLQPYYRAVSRNVIGGIVKRIREPGCKHDEMMILTGPQGLGKSTLCKTLALNDEWFSDEVLLGDASKELVLALCGKSIFEIGELGGMAKRDVETVKAMLSREVDRGRPAYGRTIQHRKRRCIFIGTTNDQNPLQDDTGNRRYLPVEITSEPDIERFKADLPQIVGEACVMQRKGISFRIPRDLWGVTRAVQEAAREQSSIDVMLADFFSEEHVEGQFVTSADTLRALKDHGIGTNPRVLKKAMLRLKFRSANFRVGPNKTLRGYRRGGPAEPSLNDMVKYVYSPQSRSFKCGKPGDQSLIQVDSLVPLKDTD